MQFVLIIHFESCSLSHIVDEEYRRIITGGEGSDEDPDEEARRQFVLADVDGSGSVSLTEFLRLSREQQQQHMGGALGNEVKNELTTRLTKLERQVEANSKKLDRICDLLETMKRK